MRLIRTSTSCTIVGNKSRVHEQIKCDYATCICTPGAADLSNSGSVTLSSARGTFSLQVCMSNLQAFNYIDTLTVLLFAEVVFWLTNLCKHARAGSTRRGSVCPHASLRGSRSCTHKQSMRRSMRDLICIARYVPPPRLLSTAEQRLFA